MQQQKQYHGCDPQSLALLQADEREENSDDEGEDLEDGMERDYMPIKELDTYDDENIDQVCLFPFFSLSLSLSHTHTFLSFSLSLFLPSLSLPLPFLSKALLELLPPHPPCSSTLLIHSPQSPSSIT